MGCAMYRFLLRPRWIAGHVLLLVTVIAFVNLGFWQLRRLHERQAYNALVTARLGAPAAPLDEVRAAHADEPDAVEFRRVRVQGAFLPAAQLLTAPRSFEGRPGQQVLSVLEPDDGPAVLVDRGWIPFDRATARPPPVPAGDVRIEGVLRAAEPGAIGDATQVVRIVPRQIARRLGRPLAAGYVQLRSQRPTDPGGPRPTPLPELTEGSHRSYALQWFSFALIALIGYPLLLRRTAAQDGQDGQDDGDTRPESKRHRDVTGTPIG